MLKQIQEDKRIEDRERLSGTYTDMLKLKNKNFVAYKTDRFINI